MRAHTHSTRNARAHACTHVHAHARTLYAVGSENGRFGKPDEFAQMCTSIMHWTLHVLPAAMELCKKGARIGEGDLNTTRDSFKVHPFVFIHLHYY